MSDVGFPGLDGLIAIVVTLAVFALAAMVAGAVLVVRARRRKR